MPAKTSAKDPVTIFPAIGIPGHSWDGALLRGIKSMPQGGTLFLPISEEAFDSVLGGIGSNRRPQHVSDELLTFWHIIQAAKKRGYKPIPIHSFMLQVAEREARTDTALKHFANGKIEKFMAATIQGHLKSNLPPFVIISKIENIPGLSNSLHVLGIETSVRLNFLTPKLESAAKHFIDLEQKEREAAQAKSGDLGKITKEKEQARKFLKKGFRNIQPIRNARVNLMRLGYWPHKQHI